MTVTSKVKVKISINADKSLTSDDAKLVNL